MSKNDIFNDVSRETFERLETYVDLLVRWNSKINLVSKTTIPQVWERHLTDSAQLFSLSSTFTSWVDMGSGGGFPGLVIAIYAAEFCSEGHVTLIESDQRKCAFLRTVGRETGVDVTVISERIESVPPQNADVISARALTSLDGLLEFSVRHMDPNGTALFLKGARWNLELEEAKRLWRFRYEAHQSKTDPEAVILEVGGIERVQ
ncbi:16S rRNA (guanine(527)-N(7))-methyltransferase RsmG [Pseudooceanicola spongiae]|uniref:Ribosomal RNA small subunit methyltransferase G n=1 Tax=Pseudooceanicola spongiae TaxID=2613965 RepID=A0A7L9WQB3_9RHOB|nr:16S rRNA (guanine(527)-N(7))-methyltransferase RsmG [Pseudooceanicola spongiae]QOL82044.1 16S rRNA (guanine(527)-N(7))-methyltransferase RsmG [Pseudooceanicola spongiae]